MEWASRASKCCEWKGKKTGYKKLYLYLFVCLSVHVSETFEWIDQFGRNFQGLVGWLRLTSGQSLLGRTWPESNPFPWSLSPLWSCYTILWTHLTSQTIMYEQNFWGLWQKLDLWFTRAWTIKGVEFFCKFSIFHQIHPSWNQILITFLNVQLFNRTLY